MSIKGLEEWEAEEAKRRANDYEKSCNNSKLKAKAEINNETSKTVLTNTVAMK